jgi:hypothetical protein
MADWLCSGLQIRVSRFDSGFRLQIFLSIPACIYTSPPVARVVKLVDTRDLKSLVRKDVPVQVRPRAPFLEQTLSYQAIQQSLIITSMLTLTR